ncbi:methyltransferase domain-containing protein [Streptomyces sp. JV176]|uniref:methyltransferase domain-containing protein n=1 Tax=Streptomyces sp. JV176 TaxID=858630 RepID=UPI002E7A1C2C|nr:methyltransferase domain-containing protein [Streptomyces sp. JV176]MEE1799757.1 methyltransferase domain-containing protein [Streptomyces sp. JV176]
MRAVGVLVVQHARGEGPYAIGEALAAAGLPVRLCRVWAGDPLPESLAGVEALVVMGGPAAAYRDDGFPTRRAELALLRRALAAEVPVLGVCLGAQLLAVAAGGTAHPGAGPQVGWGDVRTSPAAARDPLLAGTPERLRVLHWHGDTMTLPAGAVPLASCERYPVQAFRVGGAAWGLQFHLEADKAAVDAFVAAFPAEAATAPGLREAAPDELAAPAPYRDLVFGRFAALVAARAGRTATRTFFTPKADSWETRFAADGPRYAEAVARLGLRPGQTALDLGCGTGRALPALRAEVGDRGAVLGVDVTSAMLLAAAREGRGGPAGLLLADCCQLPLPPGTVDGIFTAGLLDHLPDPAAALREWARVTAPSGALLLFHPSGRVERAARHGRPLSPDDPLGEPNLRPLLTGAGWRLERYEDADPYFLARAVRAG